MRKTLIVLWMMLIASVAMAQQTYIEAEGKLHPRSLPTTKVATVLPAKVPGADGLDIDGPSIADVDEYVHLEVIGLPPIDSSQTLEEALAWTRNIAMQVQQPFDVTLGFRLLPVLRWKLTLDLKASAAGDYAVAFAMPGVDGGPVQLATHGVRFGAGPIPPEPDPVLQVSPEELFASRGPPGGPFDPPGKPYLVTNVGQGYLNWGVSISEPWLSVSPSSGVLGPGQSTEAIVGLTKLAETLPVGIHASAVLFQNVTNGKGNTPRLAALTVQGEPPPPPVRELWGVVVYEGHEPDTAVEVEDWIQWTKVLTSERIDGLFESGHYRKIDKDEDVSESLQSYVDHAESKPLPYFMLVNEEGEFVWEGVLPKSIDATVQIIQKYLPEHKDHRKEHRELPRSSEVVPRIRICTPGGCLLVPMQPK